VNVISPELIVALSSLIGAIISLFAAWFSYQREKKRDRVAKQSALLEQDSKRIDIIDRVNDETVDLYKHLTEQFQSTTAKDRKTLRDITTVIRKLMVLERTVTETTGRMSQRMRLHSDEAKNFDCPFYEEMSDFYLEQIKTLQYNIGVTMDEVDRILLNGIATPPEKKG